MARKKHNFHCQKCGVECTIYKKGKGHRVLVCPQCGVLATNPLRFSLGNAVLGAGTGAGVGALAGGVGAIPGAIVGGLTGGLSYEKKEKKQSNTDEHQSIHNHLTSFEKALLLERLEH